MNIRRVYFIKVASSIGLTLKIDKLVEFDLLAIIMRFVPELQKDGSAWSAAFK